MFLSCGTTGGPRIFYATISSREVKDELTVILPFFSDRYATVWEELAVANAYCTYKFAKQLQNLVAFLSNLLEKCRPQRGDNVVFVQEAKSKRHWLPPSETTDFSMTVKPNANYGVTLNVRQWNFPWCQSSHAVTYNSLAPLCLQ